MKVNITHIEPKYKRGNKWNGRAKSTTLFLQSYTKDEEKVKELEKYSPDKIVDQWFWDWKIGHLTKKSEAWSKAKRLSNKYVYKAIKSKVPCKSVVYSSYAGCSMCPCSPGYRINQPEDHELVGTEIDMEIILSDDERNELIDKLKALEPIVALEWVEEKQLQTA